MLDQIEAYLQTDYRSVAKQVKQAKGRLTGMNQTTRYLESVPNYQNIEIGALVNYLVLDAVKAGASDIHIEPWESTLVVRIRLIGVLTELVHLPLDLMEKISGRFKVMANLISYQTDLPQEGHAPGHRIWAGWSCAFRFFRPCAEKKSSSAFSIRAIARSILAALGFDEETLQVFMQLLARPSGLILLTGPTGSGKTTAIYSALVSLVQKHGPTISISTVEDPVEFNLPMISQAQINRARSSPTRSRCAR